MISPTARNPKTMSIPGHTQPRAHFPCKWIEPGDSFLLLFLVALLAVADCHSNADRHEPDRRNQQNGDGAINGMLAVFAGGGGRRVAHGTALAESWSSPQHQE